jgi:radical SAM peptide maturase (CXXX-repeat target family)
MTFSRDDLPYLCDSIVHVWELGIKDVAANVVFEDVWQPGDPELLEAELRRLADAALAEGWWRTHRCGFFWEPESKRGKLEEDDENYCGTGKMVSVDSRGNLFPCYRFHDFSLCHQPARSIGSVHTGYDEDRIRAFYCLRKSLQCPDQCRTCEMKERCAWCTAHNYDTADSDTVFQRATCICEMHKARWRANQYYWDRLEQTFGVTVEGSAAGGSVCPL